MVKDNKKTRTKTSSTLSEVSANTLALIYEYSPRKCVSIYFNSSA